MSEFKALVQMFLSRANVESPLSIKRKSLQISPRENNQTERKYLRKSTKPNILFKFEYKKSFKIEQNQ